MGEGQGKGRWRRVSNREMREMEGLSCGERRGGERVVEREEEEREEVEREEEG